MICRGLDFPAIVWFGSFPPPPPVSTLSLFLSLIVCRQSSMPDGRGGRRGWARSQIIRRQEILVLYKSFNTLWLVLQPFSSWLTAAILSFFSGLLLCHRCVIRTEIPQGLVHQFKVSTEIRKSTCTTLHMHVFSFEEGSCSYISKSFDKKGVGTFNTRRMPTCPKY